MPTLFFILSKQFAAFMDKVYWNTRTVVVFIIIIVLGLCSSIITAIVASIILVEVINLLPLARNIKLLCVS